MENGMEGDLVCYDREGGSDFARQAIWQEVREMWGVSVQEAEQLACQGLLTGLAHSDPILYRMFVAERRRQQETLELIASENYVSLEVLETQGSLLTNKYAEGYPGKRYYGGCYFVNIAERLAVERARDLFQAEHANVQSHSGSQANAAAYLALLKPGETVLSMRLDHGGHLTHGHQLNFSGQLYKFVHYGVSAETECIDYDEVARLSREHRPRVILAGASAYPRTINFPRLREIADEAGAYLMVDMAHIAGLVAAGVHPSPIPYAQVVTTTTHKTLRGPRGGMILCCEELADDIDRAVFPGTQGGPLMHVIAAKAVALREAMRPEFSEYAHQIVINAQVLAETLQKEGFRLVSGGTDNHLMMVDLRSVGVTGSVAEEALETVGIAVNKNLIPYDPQPPRVASGIRIGTPAATTRGMGPPQMRQVAHLISRMLHNVDDGSVHDEVRDEVRDLCHRFPVPIVGVRV
ncbi:MAG: serine hydroxymethyltransferase [Chloroflexota bacterium]|nr:serine hydroxymethyltransferase [Chloroflexota bacterium]